MIKTAMILAVDLLIKVLLYEVVSRVLIFDQFFETFRHSVGAGLSSRVLSSPSSVYLCYQHVISMLGVGLMIFCGEVRCTWAHTFGFSLTHVSTHRLSSPTALRGHLRALDADQRGGRLHRWFRPLSIKLLLEERWGSLATCQHLLVVVR